MTDGWMVEMELEMELELDLKIERKQRIDRRSTEAFGSSFAERAFAWMAGV